MRDKRLPGCYLRMGMALMLLALVPACPDALYNNVASLGGTTAGQRGNTSVVIENQTPYRAIFTIGVYDPQDETSKPVYYQFAVDSDQTQNTFNRGLAAAAVTPQGAMVFTCGRVVSFGGQEMIDRINADNLAPANGAPVNDAALRAGIYFSDKPLDDSDANGVTDPVLHADPVTSLLGPDYECDALLIYRIMLDSSKPDGVRVTIDVIPGEPAS